MIMEVMKLFIIVLLCSISLLSQTKDISILTLFNQSQIFNDDVTYNIVTFDYDLENETDFVNDGGTVKVGIVSSDNILVDLIWEYQSMSEIDPENLIQSIELIDLNHDQLKDLVINYYDIESDFPDQIISSFLINNNNKFQEISETFVKSRFEMLENSHIKYQTPLSMFGRPYIDDETQKNSNYWVDHYEFQGLKLINVNQKYRDFYEDFSKKSTEDLNKLLENIRMYKMTDEITINQLQLEEYFNQITELKIIIYRSNKVLY